MQDIIIVLLNKKVIVPLLIILFSVLIYISLSTLIKKILTFKLKGVRINDRRHNTTVGLITNILKYFIAIIALLMILDVYGIDTKSLIASLGVVSLVAGLALQDFLKDIIAGMSILFEDQYAVGDVVTIGDFKGTVTYLGVKSTRIKSFTGEVLIISNRNIDKVINHSLENCTSYIDIPVSYDSNISFVKEILDETCQEIFTQLKLSEKPEVRGIQEFGENGIVIRVAFNCSYDNKIVYEQKFREQIKNKFDENNIEIPFTQVVVHHGK